MSLLSKYKPSKLEDIKSHPKIIPIFEKFAETRNVPHLLICGKAGSGKKTIVDNLIKKLFDLDELSDSELIEYKASHKIYKYFIQKNNNYVIINLTKLLVSDKQLIETVIKEFTESYSLISYLMDIPFHLIIIKGANYLTNNAQNYLRRLIERLSMKYRFILVTEHLSKIIEPLCSLLLQVRIPTVEKQDRINIIRDIIKKENIKKGEAKINSITKKNDLTTNLIHLNLTQIRNPSHIKKVSQTLLELEEKKEKEELDKEIIKSNSSKKDVKKIKKTNVSKSDISSVITSITDEIVIEKKKPKDGDITKTEWKKKLDKICDSILKTTIVSTNTYMNIRKIIYKIIIIGIPPYDIIIHIVDNLLEKMNNYRIKTPSTVDISKFTPENELKIINMASKYECRLNNGNKPLFYIETFISHLILILH